MPLKMKRILAVLVLVCMIFSATVHLPISVEAAQPVSYSKQNNSGDRDEVCTSLSGTSALEYYTGDYTYDNLSELSSSALKSSLNKLMTSTHTYTASYDDCHNLAYRTDCENGDERVTLIYTSYSATMDQWNGWNREHVWPQSLGGGNTTGGGADLHHVRPSDAGVNSSRGNKPYGESGDNSLSKYGTDPAEGVLGGTYNSTYFEPLDNVKGDVARICLYVYVRWGSAWGADDVTEVFESIDILLEWCELDPVDTWEMGRNEVVEDIQGNRNVFIDYPELAWQLFDEEIPDDMVTPSGMAMSGGNGDQTTTEKPDMPETGDGEVEYNGALYNNIYFGDTLRFMFASGVKPSVSYTDANGDTVSLTVKPFEENGERVVVNGCPAWITTKGVPAQNIDQKVTVKVGNRVETYSVLEYLYTRLYVSENVTSAESRMYDTLLDYAKKADVVLNGVPESNIGTEYLVRVTNGTIDGATASDLFGQGDTPLANISTDISVADGKKLAFTVSVTQGSTTTTATYTDEEIKTLAVTGHTVITAIEAEDDSTEKEPAWKLVTDASQLSVGDKIIIAANGYDLALSATQNNNNRGQTAITKNGDTVVTPSSSVQIITLEKGTADGTFAFNTGSAGYLYAASSSNNYLKTRTTLDANASWLIEVSGDGIAQITSQGSYTRNILKYNKQSALFSCYASTSTTMLPVSIYVLEE